VEQGNDQGPWSGDVRSSDRSAAVRAGDSASRDAQGAPELHRCPECSSDLVHPLDWMPIDPVYWRVALRCPECEWRSVGLYEQDVLDRYEQVLDAGTDSLYADLRKLERSNMEAELRRFNDALDGDLILPEDF
jgi:hypothetical protein